MPNPSLTIRDVARRYGLSHWTVRLHLRQGLLPAYRVGGQWRFDASELDALDKTRHQPGRATRMPEGQA